MCFRRKCSLSRSFLYSFRLFIVSRLPLTFSSLSVGPGVVPISRFFLNFYSSLLRMSLSFFILFFIPTYTCRCWIEFLSAYLPSPCPSPPDDQSLLRRSLKRGSRLWKAGECFSLTLIMTVLLFLRMASSLGRTRGKLRLQCPGPTEWREEWSGRWRSSLDLKTEEGWLRREGLWCFEKSRLASLILVYYLQGCNSAAIAIIRMCQCLPCDCLWCNCCKIGCSGLATSACCCSVWCCKPEELLDYRYETVSCCCGREGWEGCGGACCCLSLVLCAPRWLRTYSRKKDSLGAYK